MILATGHVAHAQDIETPTASSSPLDWTVTRFTEDPALIATIQFDNGLTLVARCMDNVYDVIISGLPPAGPRERTRQIGLMLGDDTSEDTTTWTVGANASAAFSRLPAMVARRLAEGGKLQIIVPGPSAGAPRTRYVMELDPSSRAIERTLTACGRPLVDLRRAERDGDGSDGLPANIRWARRPKIEFPDAVGGRSPRLGYVVLSCVVAPQGRLTDCVTESEQPPAYNLGSAVQRALPLARVRQSDEGKAAGLPLEGRLIIFAAVFSMAN